MQSRRVFVGFCLAWGMLACAGVQTDKASPHRTDMSGSLHFVLPDLKGRPVHMDDLRNKVVLIAFWNAHCDPCLLELPILQKIWERYKKQGLEMIAISIDGPDLQSVVRQMVRRYNMRFPVLLDQETEVANRYNPKLICPYSLLVDRLGRIVFVHQGYRPGDEIKIEQEIKKLLAVSG